METQPKTIKPRCSGNAPLDAFNHLKRSQSVNEDHVIWSAAPTQNEPSAVNQQLQPQWIVTNYSVTGWKTRRQGWCITKGIVINDRPQTVGVNRLKQRDWSPVSDRVHFMCDSAVDRQGERFKSLLMWAPEFPKTNTRDSLFVHRLHQQTALISYGLQSMCTVVAGGTRHYRVCYH